MEVCPTCIEVDSSFSYRGRSYVRFFHRHCVRLSWKSLGSRLHPQKLLSEVEKSVGTLHFHGSIPFPRDFHGNRNHVSRSVMRKASKGPRSARCMEQVDSSASVPAAAVVAAVSRALSRVRRGFGGWERRRRRRREHPSDCRAQDGKHTLSRIAQLAWAAAKQLEATHQSRGKCREIRHPRGRWEFGIVLRRRWPYQQR